ncbi:TetR family transcriptional regulator [Rhodobacteraceae bacterium CCMM004]|nr:TetR family transcriptional regulator [Rhodobacteraceae bacterium CCMM004]
MRQFGLHGYEATSLRAVVGDANQNVSSVKYHFGSKEGLFDACVRTAARRLKAEGPGDIVTSETANLADLSPERAQAMIRMLIDAALRDALRRELADELRFLQREIVIGGRGAGIFYDEVLRDHVAFFAELFSIAEALNEEDARLRALAIMMQTILFLSAGPVIETGIGWRITSERIPALVDALYPEPRTDLFS